MAKKLTEACLCIIKANPDGHISISLANEGIRLLAQNTEDGTPSSAMETLKDALATTLVSIYTESIAKDDKEEYIVQLKDLLSRISHKYAAEYRKNHEKEDPVGRLADTIAYTIVSDGPLIPEEYIGTEKYTLVGIDGNAYSIMGYTANALRKEGLARYIEEMRERAMSGDYNNLINVCSQYIDMANEQARKRVDL